AGLAALTLNCDDDLSCQGQVVNCGGAGCLVSCRGDDSCNIDMNLTGQLARADCTGAQSCNGNIDCSRDGQGCAINCGGVDSCLQTVSCGEQGGGNECTIQ